MDRLQSYRSWWQPLPAWLKLVTLVGIYPAWLFIVVCVCTGASKSKEALLAFGVCVIGTLLHIAFDHRDHGNPQQRNGVDFGGGE
ncbi:hypothetical protein LK533_14830 [Sphingomonas sp. PL-96]|uniref:hypothetical protein n=1 Tax=Sphingomonas sp. PL-96 TaxID=2887201 RepID=UPI001E29F216|nr:hypothetical protein [Sphingomonas sp. PL-96]MCC2977944.1 hypothetical protein [Sphingomonas sp. PL-96]